ncbi:hypothetical protein ACWGKK_44115 [Streptomyces chartreusis]|uniref:hypothetical protein n=1 Tax=Streptomyces chartreusis TaxID=1969 RepID=UPI00379D1034
MAKNNLTEPELRKLDRLIGRLCLRAEDIADDDLSLSRAQGATSSSWNWPWRNLQPAACSLNVKRLRPSHLRAAGAFRHVPTPYCRESAQATVRPTSTEGGRPWPATSGKSARTAATTDATLYTQQGGDTYVVQGDPVTDPAELAQLDLADGESAVTVPRELLANFGPKERRSSGC